VGQRLRHSSPWPALIGALALLGLVILPIDYRGGSDQPHAHSLLQLLLDGSDGHLLHTHAASVAHEAATDEASWFDPGTGSAGESAQIPVADTQVDAGQPHGAASTFSSIPMVLVAMIAVMAPIGSRREIIVGTARLAGRQPRVLIPPPRAAACR
jgi:hypothetical protein